MKHLQTLVFIAMAMAMVFAAPQHMFRRATGNFSNTNRQKHEIFNETERLLANLTVSKQEWGAEATVSLLDSCDANFIFQDEEKNEEVQRPMKGWDFCQVCLISLIIPVQFNPKVIEVCNVSLAYSLYTV